MNPNDPYRPGFPPQQGGYPPPGQPPHPGHPPHGSVGPGYPSPYSPGGYPPPHGTPPYGAPPRRRSALPLILSILGVLALGGLILGLYLGGVFDRDDNVVDYGPNPPVPPASDPRSTTWQVQFAADGITYDGQFEPVSGAGLLKIIYRDQNNTLTKVVQSCTMTRTTPSGTDYSMLCTNPRVILGTASYSPDNFTLRKVSDAELSGTFQSVGSGAARFTSGTDPRFSDGSWPATP